MKIILSGGGSGDKSKELDELFVNLLDKNKPLLYIPIAMDENKHSYESCLDWLKKTFEKYEIINYEMLLEENMNDGIDIEKYSGIYIGGGNTPYLLKTIKETGFWEILKKAVIEDIPIYGGSAGAIIFAKSISPSLHRDGNDCDLKNFEGMDVLKGVHIDCHYKKKDEDILEIIKENKIDSLIVLSEKNGIFIDGKVRKIIGQESAYIFDNKGNKKELKINTEF